MDTHAQRVALVHIRAKDTHCFSSFIDLFNYCKLVASCGIDGSNQCHIYTQNGLKEYDIEIYNFENPGNKCLVLQHNLELVWNAEPLIQT